MARKKTPLNPRDFGGQNDDYILQIITEDMQRADKFQKPFFDKFLNYYNLYNSKIPAAQMRKNGANLFIPYIYNIIETSLPKILVSILDAKPFMSYKPVGDDDEKKGQKLTNLIDFQMRQYMKAVTVLYEIFKSTLTYGTAISKQTWRYESKEVTRRRPRDTEVDMGDGTTEMAPQLTDVTETVVVYDAPAIKNIPLESFFFDPAYSDLDSSPWCAHEYYKEKHELMEAGEAGVYRNVKNLVSEESNSGALADRLLTSNENVGAMRDGVRIWEYWTNDWKVMIANKETVLQCIPNPYHHKRKPFTRWATIPMPNEFYGKSMIETLEDLQSELNTRRCQRIDNISLGINRMFKINKNANIDTAQLVSRPNGFIELDSMDDIEEMETSDITASAYKEEETIKGDMDVTSGVHNYDRGQQGSRRDTATVANLLTSASSERFKLQALMMAEDPMADLGKQLAELNKQFLEDGTWIRVVGEGGTETSEQVDFEDIDAEFDVVAVCSAIEASVNKEIRQSQLVQLLNATTNMPEVNKPALMKEIFKAFDMKDIDTLISAVPTVPAIPEDVPVDGEAAETEDAQGGLYPQLGGVGGMGSYLQTPTE